MKVWIDQDLCTGDGLCEEIAPDVFAMLDDGLAYVKDGDKILSEPGGAAGVVPVAEPPCSIAPVSPSLASRVPTGTGCGRKRLSPACKRARDFEAWCQVAHIAYRIRS